ncbi:MAG TPA: SDR family oxidoreductase [Thermoanaerobaculia bacterium]|nr:SDR family oxidoreductase [Thermoanaerobaculia bacterium]
MDPRGRHIVITGASSGIGLATALALAKRGARLTLAARRAPELDAAVRACRDAGAECGSVVTDVSVREQCFRLATVATEERGAIDVLINNAGFAIFDPIAETEPAALESMMRTNYFGTVWCTQAVLPEMLRRRGGAVINVGSIAGLMGYARMGGYCATKFAVTGFTEALRSEVQDQGIAVSLICPGTTDTDFFVTAEKGKMPGASRLILAIPPERVVAVIVKAVESGRARIIVPAGAAAFIRFKEIAPGPAQFAMRRVSQWLERKRR